MPIDTPTGDLPDPISGRLGQLVCTGWIATAPDTGRDAAFLLLATPDERAPTTMPRLAAALGIDPRPGSMTTHTDISVRVDADLWLHLLGLDGSDLGITRRVSREWEATARADARVVLVIGFRPLPPGTDTEAYSDQLADANAMALALAAYASNR